MGWGRLKPTHADFSASTAPHQHSKVSFPPPLQLAMHAVLYDGSKLLPTAPAGFLAHTIYVKILSPSSSCAFSTVLCVT